MTETSLQTGKEDIERMCRAAGVLPADRRKVRDFDLLIADGFSLPPHAAFRRFGIEADQFPLGMYATFWWLMKGEDRNFIAYPMFFDAFHDAAYDPETKKKARINAAYKNAVDFVDRMGRVLH